MNQFDIVYKLDSELNILFGNEAFFNTLKLDRQAETSLYEIISEEHHKELDELRVSLENSEFEKQYIELPFNDRSNEIVWLGQSIEKSSTKVENLKFIAVAKNLTENIKARKLVLSNEQKYREIIENIDLGLMEVDLEENILFANDSFCKSTGFSLQELKGKNASEVFSPEDSQFREIISTHNKRRFKGESSIYEMRLTKKDGTHCWMMISGAPVKNINGKVIGSIGIHHDITNRKLEEINKKKLLDELEARNDELLKKQEYLNAINEFVTGLMHANTIEDIVKKITEDTIKKFEFKDCVVYLLDESRKNLFQVSAYGPKDNKGKIVNPIVIPFGKGIVGTVAKTGRPEMISDTSQDPRYIVDDEIRFSELAVPIIADDEIIGVIDSEHPKKNFFDIDHLKTLTTIANLSATKIKSSIIRSKKKLSDQALSESEEKLRSILNSALDAVITIDENGIVTEWNPQAEILFKFRKDEAIGRKLSTLIIPEEFRLMHDKGMEHWKKTGEGPVLNKRIEITGINKDLEVFPIELSIVPVISKGQHFFSAFVRDITPRKKAEKQMQDALEKHKELNELKSRFVSMTSHEFRTPLTTIKSNIELLEWQLEKQKMQINPGMNKNFVRIGSEVKRLTELMDDILIIGRIESGKIPFIPVSNDYVLLMKEILENSFSRRKDGRSVEFYSNCEKIIGDFDPNVYDHIISNLISNAFKYSKGKGNPELHLNYKNDYLEIKVKDKGIGIPKEDLEQLFDSFYRASNVENVQGTGLGLAIVKEFAQMHSATIDISSEVNKGTEITIIQPLNLSQNKSIKSNSISN
ncbi:PAS domain S-box protein [Hyphobacterium sp. CCMP332]|nr:PAS domain S-box protein [Hyphobacterium sp. CCMP332]